MHNENLLCTALQNTGITIPKFINPSGFSRWGKGFCFWALPVGDGFVFGDWSKGTKNFAFPNNRKITTREERQKIWVHVRAEVEKERAERDRKHESVANLAAYIWNNSCHDVPPAHMYLMRKQVNGEWIRYDSANDSLIIPLHDTGGKVWNIQTIKPDGTKRFLSGGRKKGCFFTIGYLGDGPFIICEGWATGQSIYDALPCCVVFVAFDAGNLSSVASALRTKYPTKRIIIAADNDHQKCKNTGKDAALNVAQKFGLEVIIPGINQPGMSDFNDIACHYGPIEVFNQFSQGGII